MDHALRTMAFIQKFASGYNGIYGDFLKQWHYKMEIQEKCADSTKFQAFVLKVLSSKTDTNTVYSSSSILWRTTLKPLDLGYNFS